MATSKGRSGANSKAAATKQPTPAANKKSKSPSGKVSANRTGNKAIAPQKPAAAPKKAAAKSPVTGGKSGAGAATKSSATSRNSIPTKSVASRSTKAGSSAGRNAGSAVRGGATKASAVPSRKAPNASPARKSVSAKGSAATADPRNDLAKILQDLMQDIYYAEKKLTKALGKMAKNATDVKLREAFTIHQSQTEAQVSRLEEAFEMLGQKAKAKRCAAMDGLLEEANEHIEEYKKGAGLDAALIVGAQKVEHYEIAAYGSMRSIARTLGNSDVAAIFDEIREQESDIDELLTTIAESVVNLKAEGETEDVQGGSTNSNTGNSRSGKSGNDSSDDSDAGEDSSSAVSGRESSDENDSNDNDGAGRGISALTDGADRGEVSDTGEAMGY